VFLDQEDVTVGRHSASTVVIDRGGLSRQHARLRLTEQGYTIRDEGSRNGTYVNEKKIDPGTETLLCGGDLVRLADLTFRYIEPEEDSSKIGTEITAQRMQVAGLEAADDSASESDPLIGRDLGEFQVISLVNQGGMGRVYQAKQKATGRDVIVKTIIPEQASAGQLMQRFLREIDFGARITHPNITEFLGSGQVGELLFLASEYFPGKNLRQWYKRRPATPEAAIRIGIQVADALAAAHAQGVVHRDIKPENILMNDRGKVKVIDFGIAKAWADPEYVALTMSGVAVGTPRYMAPEQFTDSSRIGPATDIYALGAVLYTCLTCRPPRKGTTVMEIFRTLDQPIPPVSQFRKNLPAGLEEAVMKALAKAPEERFPTIQEMRARLQAIKCKKRSSKSADASADPKEKGE